MSAVERPTDGPDSEHAPGPDTELAAAINFLARNERLLIEMEHSPAGRAAATIVRAYLARPAAGRDLTAQDVHDAVVAWNVAPGEPDRDQFLADRLNAVARPAVARTDGQTPAPQEEHGPFEVDETIRLEGTILRLRESLADVPAAIATVRDVWANGSPEARGFLRLPDSGSWPDLARALDTLCAISAGQKGSEHRAYEEWAAAQYADGQPPADVDLPTAAAPWTVTLAYAPGQNAGAVSVMPHRVPLFAVLGTIAAGESIRATAVEWEIPERAVEILVRLRAELESASAAPADDASVQGWGDVESADFIERARAATAVGSFTAQFDHVYDPSGDFVCESVDHSTAVRIAAALSAAQADDTAAPDRFHALARKLADLNVDCTFWACPGPDTEPEDMVTCRTCWLIWEARQLLAGQPVRDSQPETT